MKERLVCWLIEENNPPKIVIIVTILAMKFNEFKCEIANGCDRYSRVKNREFNIKIKKALFW